MSSEKDIPDFRKGDIVQVKKGFFSSEIQTEVLGPPIFVRQWWVPILDTTTEEPNFFKAASLEKVDMEEVSPEVYIPSSLRENQGLDKQDQVMYAIGQEIISSVVEYRMWDGPNTSLEEMLEVVGRDANSVIIRFNKDGTDEVLYRWNGTEECWVKELNTNMRPTKERSSSS